MTPLLRLAPACAVTSLILFAAPAWAQAGAGDTAVPGNGRAAQSSRDDPSAQPGANGDSARSDGTHGPAQPDGDADAPAAAPSGTPKNGLPGVVLERNVFVPVDRSGHPASNQFIVVERRELPAKGEPGATSGGASNGPAPDVPTRFILVPQQDSDGNDGDSGSGLAPRQ